MSSWKGRTKRTGVPLAAVAMTNGAGQGGPPAEADRESMWPALRGDVVEPRSSPASSRPAAPALSFAPPPPPELPPPAPEPEPVVPDVSSDPGRDDSSVPPVDLDSRFFDAAAPFDEAPHDGDVRDPRVMLKRSPAVAMRRAHLARYVTATMGVAVALCLAAMVKSAVTGDPGARAASRAQGSSQAATVSAAHLDTVATTAQAPSPPTQVPNSAAADNAAVPDNAPVQGVAQAAPEPSVAASAEPAPQTVQPDPALQAVQVAPSAEVPAPSPAPPPEPVQAAAQAPAAPAAPTAPSAPPAELTRVGGGPRRPSPRHRRRPPPP